MIKKDNYETGRRTICRPKELRDKVFDRLFQEAEIAKFTPQELREYEASMKAYNDIQNSIDTAKEEGREEGREEGIEIGQEKERIKNAKSFLAMGLSPEQVAQGTGLSLEEVLKLTPKD